jgi:transposase
MSDTGDLHMSKPVGGTARRVEVFTGAGRRRMWRAEDKAAIVAESLAGDDTASGVARRHGLTASQLFAWSREARGHLVPDEEDAPRFVPAVLERPSEPARRGRQSKQPPKSGSSIGIVELEIDGVTVRVGRGTQAKTIAAVIRALKAGT